MPRFTGWLSDHHGRDFMKTKPRRKPKPKRSHLGTIHPPDTLFFRSFAGTAKSGRNEYEMSLNVGGSVPIVHSKQTGKWFVLPWEDIIELAIKAGVDKEKEQAE